MSLELPKYPVWTVGHGGIPWWETLERSGENETLGHLCSPIRRSSITDSEFSPGALIEYVDAEMFIGLLGWSLAKLHPTAVALPQRLDEGSLE